MRDQSKARNRKIIVIAGFDQSGKSTIADIVCSFGYLKIECGEFVRERLDVERGAALTMAYDLHMTELNAQIINFLRANIETASSSAGYVVVGVRSSELFLMLASCFGESLISIFVDCPVERRYERHCSDHRISAPQRYEQFLENDRIQTSWGINMVREWSSHLINNDASIADIFCQITDILE